MRFQGQCGNSGGVSLCFLRPPVLIVAFFETMSGLFSAFMAVGVGSQQLGGGGSGGRPTVKVRASCCVQWVGKVRV